MAIDWKKQTELLKGEYVEQLTKFLSINSIEDMTSASEGKPFGIGVAEALSCMLDKAENDGFKVKNLEGYAGYIEMGEGNDEVGVLVHVDVVPAGDGWTTPPFSPDVRNGRIYARGAIDDKGPALAAYYALKLVRDSGLQLSKRVRLIVGTDEESGWLCMKRYAELEKLPEIGFAPDAEFPIVHAEKGQISPTLVLPDHLNANETRKSKEWILHHFAAGDGINMVPDYATATLERPIAADNSAVESMLNDFSHFLSVHNLKGQATSENNSVTLHLEGKAAHAKEPYEGINAGLLLARFLRKFPIVGKGSAFMQLLADVLDEDFYGERLGLACEDEATGKLTVNAGALQYNEVTGAEVKLNIRNPATVPYDDQVAKLEKYVKSLGWEMSSVRGKGGHFVPKEHEVIRKLQRVYEEQTGQKAELLSSGGATYARVMKNGVAFGAVFPGKEMTAHHKDEYAEIDDLVRGMALYAQAIYELAK
ncbi:succinyl-diaminopimelate desuccinylase [Paenibacillus sp. yr247]|uniref:dipeptidase PepV n=1 Tax=Paenibacillus sp. yr247 TaxID=1761880 RepID=UPI00087E6835|nr:dipeptidase PepV [Paenibacillus sp. yr247]SDP13769.1 succinyl-diaminopimelate desuccinylase [Paenibacillus sp. yr247]